MGCVTLHCITGGSFRRIWPHLGELRPENHPEAACKYSFGCYENIWKFITWQPQTLRQWNLPRLRIFMRPFIWQKIGTSHIGCKRAWLKNFWKRAQKCVFGLISWNFQNCIKNYNICDTLPCTASLVKFCTNWNWLGAAMYEKPPRSSLQI